MILHNPNLFVLTGGPGAGKTTVLLELAKLGFPHAPEAAREIIREQVESGGEALPWKDREAYAALMLHRSVESFRRHTPAASPVFSDRGIPDTLCYARLAGLPASGLIQDACCTHRYGSPVFVAPPWREIYVTDSERRQGFAEAVRTYELMAEVYRECGYGCVELPKLPPAGRARFILGRLPTAAPANGNAARAIQSHR